VNGDATTPSWYYAKSGAVDGQQVGPVSWEQLFSLVQAGALNAEDLVWHPQFPSWVTVSDVPGLVAMPPLPKVQESPQEPTRPPAVQPTAPQQDIVQPATRQTGGVSPGYDPFFDDGEPGDFRSQRPWLRWGLIIGAVVIIGVIVGVYFGVIREGTAPTTTLAPTTSTTVLETTTSTTEAPIVEAIWTDLALGGELPSARSEHATAYDTTNGLLVLFGGWDSASETNNETWVFDASLGSWTDAAPTGTLPAARAQHQMAYDPISGTVVMFGGILETDGEQVGDTWAYDAAAATWTELQPTGASPSARSSFSMVYDDMDQQIILFGGWDKEESAHLDDTWAYDPIENTWTELTPAGDVPSARGSHSMAYDPVLNAVILFGGTDSTSYFDDTWIYDFATNTWTEVLPTGEIPPARAGHRMAYDPSSGTVLLFGGWNGTAYYNDTWTFDVATSTWTSLDLLDAPSARDSHSLTYDALTNELILFGGFVGGSDVAQDTWAYGVAEDFFTVDTVLEVETSVVAGTTTTEAP